MTEIPADAQRSEDGHYWWDTNSNEWKPVESGDATADPTAAGGEGDANAGQSTEIPDLTAFMEQAEQATQELA